MKIESMRTRSYRSFKVDDADLPAEARERLSAIRRYDELRAAGCAEQAALKVIGVSRRTMYRWKALDLRRKHPFVGKAQIQRMLEREGLRLSVSGASSRAPSRPASCPSPASANAGPSPSAAAGSTAGRGAGSTATRPSAPASSSNAPLAARIDHMTFFRVGQAIKEFRRTLRARAICPVSRFMVACVFSRAAFRTLRAEALGASSTPSSSTLSLGRLPSPSAISTEPVEPVQELDKRPTRGHGSVHAVGRAVDTRSAGASAPPSCGVVRL